MQVAVAIKWVDTRPIVDPLTGEVSTDDRTRGMSSADAAALEWALRLRDAFGGSVAVVCVGASGAEAMLRDGLSAGADRAVHVVVERDLESEQVARAIAAVTAEADLICCGDWSLDRGSGMVPGLVAAAHGLGQALGLTNIDVPTVSESDDAPGAVDVERRLDGGWRERLRVVLPAVISVEGGSAPLRRAPLPAVIAARSAEIDRVEPSDLGQTRSTVQSHGPFRPRTRVSPAPAGDTARDRIRELTGATVDRTPPQTISAEPAEAARLIHEQLRSWGHVD